MNENDYNKYGGNNNRRRKRKSKKEKTGFYIAFAICVVAVGMAVFSTYTGVTNYLVTDNPRTEETSQDSTEPVNEVVTGVTEENTEKTEETKAPSIIISETLPTVAATDPQETMSTEDALQTMLSVSDSLSSPLDDLVIQKKYSEDAVYNKTLNDWRAHTGIDLKSATGDNVYSMIDGTVEDVTESELLGNVVAVKTDDYIVYYCGLSKNIPVEKGQQVKTGDTIGTVGVVPFEAMDDAHLHIEIKVKGQYIDPLTVINNDE